MTQIAVTRFANHFQDDPLGFGKGTLPQKLAQACGWRKTTFVRPEGCETKWAYCVHNLPPSSIRYRDENGQEQVWKNPHPLNFPQYLIAAATLCGLYFTNSGAP